MAIPPTALGPRPRPTPQPVESTFNGDEIFFSTTDRRGVIRSGNRVFTRVSKYGREELLGRPHSIIRHPDMPRVVFKLLWEELGAGRPIVAYVKNMAKDGSYYWVLATAVPCDGGYLSVRIKPATAYFDAVQPIYHDLLAVEREVEQGDPHRREEAMEASRARLAEHLRGAGFADYGAFMRTALLAEVKQRDAARERAQQGAPAEAMPNAAPALLSMLEACSEVDHFLQTLVSGIDAYSALSGELTQQAEFAFELGEDVQLFSLNALLAASRLSGVSAAPLGAVSSLIQGRSVESRPIFRALTDDVLGTADQLAGMLLPVAIARIQAEAALAFVRELLEGTSGAQATADDLGALALCLTEGANLLCASLIQLDRRLRDVVGHVADLQRSLVTMRALELNGRIEAAHATGAEGVVTLFRTIAGKIETARRELGTLSRASSVSLAREVTAARRNQRHIATIRDLVQEISGRTLAVPA